MICGFGGFLRYVEDEVNLTFAQNLAALILFLLAFGLSLWVCLTTSKQWIFEDEKDETGANFRRFLVITFAMLLTHVSVALFNP